MEIHCLYLLPVCKIKYDDYKTLFYAVKFVIVLTVFVVHTCTIVVQKFSIPFCQVAVVSDNLTVHF